MTASPNLTLHSPISWRRSVAAALLALQALVACSFVLERQSPVQATVHAHDQETQHAFAHDESNCGLCAVRAQFAAVPPAPAVLPTARLTSRLAWSDRAAAPMRAFAPANPSRAPPLQS